MIREGIATFAVAPTAVQGKTGGASRLLLTYVNTGHFCRGQNLNAFRVLHLSISPLNAQAQRMVVLGLSFGTRGPDTPVVSGGSGYSMRSASVIAAAFGLSPAARRRPPVEALLRELDRE